MEISSATPAISGASATDTTDASGAASTITSDFETFLVMLTAQLKNQDPLNPIDSTDYATQLATFSGVEQQVKTNDLLESLAAQMGTMSMSQLSGWVGMEARVAAPVYFDGAPITVIPVAATTADAAYLVARDESGTEVQRSQIDLSGGPVTWGGVDAQGEPLAEGVYSLSVVSMSDGAVISDQIAAAYSKITEARNDNGNIFLVLESGSEIAASQVTVLRESG